MTPVCIRCNEPMPQATVAEPVMTGRYKGETLLGMRAQHPTNADGSGCEVTPSDYPGGYLWFLYEEAEKNPFPAYRKWRAPASEKPDSDD